ncbi:MAG: NUDIX domain-containing protein [Candidatus Paceibacterota bacterium]
MRLIVVNENDEVLGYKERDDRDQSDIIRVSGLWLVNDKHEALIAQRALNKFHDPGKWAISAAGTVEEGETYLTNILKEAKEELGVELHAEDLVVGLKKFVQTDHRYFCQLYFAQCAFALDDFRIQKEEVEAVRWISVGELEQWFTKHPDEFILSFGGYVEDIKQFTGH